MYKTHRNRTSEPLAHSLITVLPVGYLMLFTGIGCMLYTFAYLHVLLKQATLVPETIIPLLPIFFGGVILLVFGGIFIKSAKLVIDRPFVSLLQAVVSTQVLFVV
jgi:hypothetical protein